MYTKPLKVYQFKFPIITFLLTIIAITLYYWMNQYTQDADGIDSDTWALFGAPSAIDIYGGQFWGVITNSFLHENTYHLLFNMIGLILFGTYLEQRISHFHFFIFGLLASFITSSVQLALTDDAGLGMTGVNYAFFGYLLLRSPKDNHALVVAKQILFFLMTALVIYFIVANNYFGGNFGFESIASGFLWGTVFGLYFKNTLKAITGSLLLVTLSLSFIGLFYNPWSSDYNCKKGITYHDRNQYAKASYYYKKALAINPKNSVANKNLILIEIDELSALAYKAHISNNFVQAKRYYLRILTLDKSNEWARTNFNSLPE